LATLSKVDAELSANRKMTIFHEPSLSGQLHHRMNLPCSVIRQILSPVALIFGSMANVEVRFTDNGDDRRISDVQFPSSSNRTAADE
jgi:hypothetical protein